MKNDRDEVIDSEEIFLKAPEDDDKVITVHDSVTLKVRLRIKELLTLLSVKCYERLNAGRFRCLDCGLAPEECVCR